MNQRDPSPDGPVDRERLDLLLGGDDLAWLRDRIRQRIEQSVTVTGTVRLTQPTAAQREAADRLMGRAPSTGASVSVALDHIAQMLRDAEICDGLATAVTAIDGPVELRRAQRLALDARWAAALDGARQVVEERHGDAGWAGRWFDELLSYGLLRRLTRSPADATQLVEQALAVLDELPAEGVTTATLAARVLGDSHALDDGRPVARLVLLAIMRRTGASIDETLTLSERRRALWASGGVTCDELSSTVLVLGLEGGDTDAEDATLTDVTLRAHAAAAEPTRLTLAQISRHPPDLSTLAGRTVHVCENPAIVAAAARRLGRGSAPLLCVEGQPSAAAQRLLGRLGEAGALLTYHGDFDWPGLRIAQFVIDRFGATPWRFTTDDYLAAPAGPPLQGTPASATWDSALPGAMADRGVAVHEEQVLDTLIDDIG